jgi:UDPglucose--hexose-1-phosphate uridylyltransferase
MPAKKPTKVAGAAASEIRKDYYRENYVIISPKRNLRPNTFSHETEPHCVPDMDCPFCGSHETVLVAIPDRKNWKVRVVPNAFPALTILNTKAFGVQEVIIETPDHDNEFSDLPVADIMDVFTAFRHRLINLKKIPGIRYVLVFKNDGPMAGASISHAHSQVIALPMIPPHIESESNALVHYQEDHGNCAYCDIIAWEENQKVRVVWADKNMVAVAPYAASAGFGLWIIPRRHKRLFTDLTATELRSLAVMLKEACTKLDAASISFNYFLQESIPHLDNHFVLKIEPRLFKYAGAELGTGVIINPVPPEYAAKWYQGKA